MYHTLIFFCITYHTTLWPNGSQAEPSHSNHSKQQHSKHFYIFFDWCMHAMSPLGHMLVCVCVWRALCTPRPIPGNFQETTGNCLGIARLARAPEKRQHAKAGWSFIDAATVHPASLVWHVTAGLVPFQLRLPRLASRWHLGASRRCWAVAADRKHIQHPVMHRRS